MRDLVMVADCFQSVKVIKFESNSQQQHPDADRPDNCFQSVKVIKFESNSQLRKEMDKWGGNCFQSVKVIKFESNSQLLSILPYLLHTVFSLSKL